MNEIQFTANLRFRVDTIKTDGKDAVAKKTMKYSVFMN